MCFQKFFQVPPLKMTSKLGQKYYLLFYHHINLLSLNLNETNILLLFLQYLRELSTTFQLLTGPQRRITLRISCVYKTISLTAEIILASLIPVHLKVLGEKRFTNLAPLAKTWRMPQNTYGNALGTDGKTSGSNRPPRQNGLKE